LRINGQEARRTKGTLTRPDKRPIEQYSHTDKKRVNNPPVGLVTPDTDQIGSPRLFSPECRTPRQMELANVLCRYSEMSVAVRFGADAVAGEAH
jgi:hypothetical protein